MNQITFTEAEYAIKKKTTRRALRRLYMVLPSDIRKALEGRKFVEWINGLSDAEIIERFIVPAREFIQNGESNITRGSAPVFQRGLKVIEGGKRDMDDRFTIFAMAKAMERRGATVSAITPWADENLMPLIRKFAKPGQSAQDVINESTEIVKAGPGGGMRNFNAFVARTGLTENMPENAIITGKGLFSVENIRRIYINESVKDGLKKPDDYASEFPDGVTEDGLQAIYTSNWDGYYASGNHEDMVEVLLMGDLLPQSLRDELDMSRYFSRPALDYSKPKRSRSPTQRSSSGDDTQSFDTDTVLYHGTSVVFSEFKAGKGMLGRGVYLTSDPSAASRYAEGCVLNKKRKGDAPNVMPVYVRGNYLGAATMTREQYVDLMDASGRSDMGDDVRQDIEDIAEDPTRDEGFDGLIKLQGWYEMMEYGASQSGPKFNPIKILKSLGYDGVKIIEDFYDESGRAEGREYPVIMVFDPVNIRSVNALAEQEPSLDTGGCQASESYSDIDVKPFSL